MKLHAYADPWYITSFNGDDVRALATLNGDETTIIDIIGTQMGGDLEKVVMMEVGRWC